MEDQQQMGGMPSKDRTRQQTADIPKRKTPARAPAQPEAAPDRPAQMGDTLFTDWASI